MSLEEATAALEASEWELLDAALLLEKEHGAQNAAYSTRREAAEEPSRREQAKARRRGVVEGLGGLLRSAFNLGNRNRFEVRRGEELLLEMPVLVLAFVNIEYPIITQ